MIQPLDIHSITSIFVILIVSVAVEAISEIITSSEIFRPLHDLIKKSAYPTDSPPPDTLYQKIKVWFDKLISCGYCTSVWVAGILSVLLVNNFTSWLIITFVTHRLATCFHVLYELVRKGRVKTYDIEVSYRESYDGDDGESAFEGSSETQPRIFKAGRSQDLE